MITFVDTNVLLDVFLPDPKHGDRSAEALEQAFGEGSLVINGLVYAELSPQFGSRKRLDGVLDQLGLRILEIDREVAFDAGQAWKAYRSSGGKRDRILADFLIGAHALKRADRLLTRDRGFYKRYFKSIAVLKP